MQRNIEFSGKKVRAGPVKRKVEEEGFEVMAVLEKAKKDCEEYLG